MMKFEPNLYQPFTFSEGRVQASIKAYRGVWEGAGGSMKPIMPDEVGRSAARSIQRPTVSSVYPGLSIDTLKVPLECL